MSSSTRSAQVRDEVLRQRRLSTEQRRHDAALVYGKLSWERLPIFANDHDLDCTCCDCLMQRLAGTKEIIK